MEEPLTQNSMVLKHSLAVNAYSTPGKEQLEHHDPASSQPRQLLSNPAMTRRAEIRRFAVFLLCSLVLLGSLARTDTSGETKTTTGQMLKYFTTSIKILAAVIERQATALFKNYNVCSSVTHKTVSWLTANAEVRAMVKKIPTCPAFEKDCCVLHVFYNVLQSLRREIESMCSKNLTQLVDASINQLRVTLSERAALYTCKKEDVELIDHRQVQRMGRAQKSSYIWQILQKYEQVMQNTTKTYSSVEM